MYQENTMLTVYKPKIHHQLCAICRPLRGRIKPLDMIEKFWYQRDMSSMLKKI